MTRFNSGVHCQSKGGRPRHSSKHDLVAFGQKMNWGSRIDRVLAIAVLVIGAAQALAAFFVFPQIGEPTAWFAFGGMFLAFVGALSVVRNRSGGTDRWLIRVSVLGNVLVAVFWLVLACFLSYKFNRYPAAYVAAAIICLHAVVSVLRMGVA